MGLITNIDYASLWDGMKKSRACGGTAGVVALLCHAERGDTDERKIDYLRSAGVRDFASRPAQRKAATHHRMD